MNYILFDDIQHQQLYPITLTRSMATILCGIWTMQERWSFYLNTKTSILTNASLQALYQVDIKDEDCIYINAAYFAQMPLVEAILRLDRHEVLMDEKGGVIAYRSASPIVTWEAIMEIILTAKIHIIGDEGLVKLNHLWDIFGLSGYAINADFDAIGVKTYSQKIPDYVTVVGNKDQIIIEQGAKINPCIINCTTGPVYIGADAEIMEGSIIRGPFAMRNHAVLKMGAKVYGPTTIGEGSKVGGEVNNMVMFNNSNKGHDGFIGNAVIGEWCNLGADTNCSNLKNNYDEVKIWDIAQDKLIPTGLQFCGLIMGDHSKCGINTMFNTGTVVGVSANIFGAGFPDKYIPSFTWGGAESSEVYLYEKAVDTANRMMQRRNKQLSVAESDVLYQIFKQRVSK